MTPLLFWLEAAQKAQKDILVSSVLQESLTHLNYYCNSTSTIHLGYVESGSSLREEFS